MAKKDRTSIPTPSSLEVWSCILATLHWVLSLLSLGACMFVNYTESKIKAFMKYQWHQWKKDEQAIMRDEI